jgi:transcriptional regulator with XRE-family HTH domain
MKQSELFKKNYHLLLKQQVMLQGLSLRELADKTGYSYEGVRQILKGRGSYRGVFKICKVLRYDMKNLLNEELIN